MTNLDTNDLEATYETALASAVLLRREGEAPKAARLESLARILGRELERRVGERSGSGRPQAAPTAPCP